MTTARRGDWIQTAVTKKQFWPLDPRPEDVHIEDIAHALTNICRFGGHTKDYYSVGQHSVLCSEHAPPDLALAALLHDAAEAYCGDIPRPWKKFLWVAPTDRIESLTRFKQMESSLLDVIFLALDVGPLPGAPRWATVAEIDLRMLATEARDLMSPLAGDEWANTFQKAPCEARYAYNPYPDVIQPWTPAEAKAKFLARWRALTAARSASEAEGTGR